MAWAEGFHQCLQTGLPRSLEEQKLALQKVLCVLWGPTVVPNLGRPDVLGLRLPEILASKGGGEGFWELSSKNIWRPKVGEPLL